MMSMNKDQKIAYMISYSVYMDEDLTHLDFLFRKYDNPFRVLFWALGIGIVSLPILALLANSG